MSICCLKIIIKKNEKKIECESFFERYLFIFEINFVINVRM